MGMKSKEWNKLVAGKACSAGHVGLMVPDVIWNMGDPGVRDFEDVWRCRECGEIVPMTEEESRALNGLD